MVRGAVSKLSEEVRDCLFLGIVFLFSVLLYIKGIGFYSDDWAFFGASYSSSDRSLMGLFHSLNGPIVWMRPVQVFYLALLYRWFDLNPLGYHIINHLVFLAGILLFYKVLSLLRQPRMLCLSIPLLFAVIPHYSTDRFWPILFCANLSMATYFLSLYFDLRMLTESGLRIWIWKLLGVLSLLVGTLAYEVFLPLFLVNAVVVWIMNQRKGSAAISKPKMALLLGCNLLAISIVVLFKAMITTRMVMQGPADHIVWFVNLMIRAFLISFGKLGVELPFVIKTIVFTYPDWKVFAVSLMIGVFSYFYLIRIQKEDSTVELKPKRMAYFLVSGLALFVLGYMIFITNENADPTAAGLNNRTAIAAAVGVAFCLVSTIGWVSTFIRTDKLRNQVFAFLIAVLCAAGTLVTNTIAHFWVQGYSEELKVLSDIRRQYKDLPPNSTLILDGVCPYIGPGIVFESGWDLGGALKIYYQDSTLQADIVKPSTRITEEGLQTTLYGAVSNHPYENLYIYNYGRKISIELKNALDAQSYFQSYNPSFGLECPDSKEGEGVTIF